MRIEDIYKGLVSIKKKHNEYILYRYDVNTGAVKSYKKDSEKQNIEHFISENDLVRIPYSLFITEGKRLKRYLAKSRT